MRLPIHGSIGGWSNGSGFAAGFRINCVMFGCVDGMMPGACALRQPSAGLSRDALEKLRWTSGWYDGAALLVLYAVVISGCQKGMVALPPPPHRTDKALKTTRARKLETHRYGVYDGRVRLPIHGLTGGWSSGIGFALTFRISLVMLGWWSGKMSRSATGQRLRVSTRMQRMAASDGTPHSSDSYECRGALPAPRCCGRSWRRCSGATTGAKI